MQSNSIEILSVSVNEDIAYKKDDECDLYEYEEYKDEENENVDE